MGVLSCERCGRWHFTRRSHRSCAVEHKVLSTSPSTIWDDEYPLEAQMRAKALRHARQHVPTVPTDPVEAQLTQWSNSQLAHVTDFSALDLLVSSAVYTLNRDLRTTPGRWTAPDAYADYEGYRCNGEVDGEAREFFASVNLKLPRTVRAFRGSRMPATTIPAAGSVYEEQGYVFASLDEDTARTYAEPNDTGDRLYADHLRRPEVVKVLWELRLHHGVFLPAPEARSRNLVERMCGFRILKNADPQVVIASGSRWKIRSRVLEQTGTIRLFADQV